MTEGARRAGGIGAAAVLGGATMVVALLLQLQGEARGIAGTFAAWWVGVLVLLAPVLGLGAGRDGHGMRALGWLGLLPVVALTTLLATSLEVTAPWGFVCGTPMAGLTLLPFFVPVLVLVAGSVSHVVVEAVGRRVVALGAAWALVVSLAFAAVLVAAPAAPSAAERLVQGVHALAPIPPPGAAPLAVEGTQLAWICDSDDRCELEVDGIRADRVTARDAPLELAEGLGYRFVRPVGSPPRAWLAFRRGEAYGQWLRPDDLPGPVAAPPGLGSVLALSLAVALLFVSFALARVPRLVSLRRAVPAHVLAEGVVAIGAGVFACDPRIAVGPALAARAPHDVATYRALGGATAITPGAREDLALREWRAIGEHCAMALVLLALGCTPAMVALRQGLVVGW